MNQPNAIFMTNWPEELVARLAALAPPSLTVTPADFSMGDEERIPLCRDADFLVVTPSNVSEELVKTCPGLKLIQLLSAGYERIDVEFVMSLGVPIANNGGANGISVAEHTIGLMIVLLRQMFDQWQGAKKGRWKGRKAGRVFEELAGKTVGIIGLGRIGQEVAKRLKPWEVTLLYHNRRRLSTAPLSRHRSEATCEVLVAGRAPERVRYRRRACSSEQRDLPHDWEPRAVPDEALSGSCQHISGSGHRRACVVQFFARAADRGSGLGRPGTRA